MEEKIQQLEEEIERLEEELKQADKKIGKMQDLAYEIYKY